MINLYFCTNLLKTRCLTEYKAATIKQSDITIIVPKKGSKRFIDVNCNKVAANDDLDKIWASVYDKKAVYCYDFDNFPINTQQLIYYLDSCDIYVWTKPAYVRDCYNIADNDYLYKMYMDVNTKLHITGNIKFQNLPKNERNLNVQKI